MLLFLFFAVILCKGGELLPLTHYQPMALSELEKEMPMAFVRVVYTDYWFLEAELLVNYAPNNWYCYVLDLKSTSAFTNGMRRLASFFDNVIVMEQMFDFHPNGTNVNNAMIECARALSDPQKHWKYMVTLQNHDIQAKTNKEMAQIFTWLGGANDVHVDLVSEMSFAARFHYKRNFNWTLGVLNLFKEKALNYRYSHDGWPMALTVSRGYVAASLSRQFVDFVVTELDLTTLLDQLNNGIFGVDEHLWQTLSTSEALNIHGGFPNYCFVDNTYKYITRYVVWTATKHYDKCLFNLSDLLGKGTFMPRTLPHLFVNRMGQSLEPLPIFCWHEKIREMRRLGKMELDEHFYKDWPQTRYQQDACAGFGEEVIQMDCKTGIVGGSRLRFRRDSIWDHEHMPGGERPPCAFSSNSGSTSDNSTSDSTSGSTAKQTTPTATN